MIIGICGGTGSGKTTVAENLVEALGQDQALLLAQDCYYKDTSHLPFDQRAQLNFDHPDSVDFELMVEHLNLPLQDQPIQRPSYDFSLHVRRAETLRVERRAVVIVEGILIYQNQKLRELFDLKVFVDTEPDVRFIRRLKRDVRERGRTVDSVIQQYLETVRPMHLEYVEPGKRFADVIIPEGGKNSRSMDLLIQWVKSAESMKRA
jgi:uridine kinase